MLGSTSGEDVTLMNGYIILPPRGHRIVPRNLAKLAGYQCISYEKQAPVSVKPNSVIINWGNKAFNREICSKGNFEVFNPPHAIKQSSHKIHAFKLLDGAGINIPEYTEHEEIAKQWWAEGKVVYTRTLVNSHSGKGITVQLPEDTWKHIPEAKFHTKRYRGKHEFRIHVFNGEIIHVQQKKRKKDVDHRFEFYVKNIDNGYIFAIQDVEIIESVRQAAVKAVDALGLSFGAVDIGYAPTTGNYCVFEINTRPMLTGTTMIKYREALIKLGENNEM